jgi:hypothetical protein
MHDTIFSDAIVFLPRFGDKYQIQHLIVDVTRSCMIGHVKAVPATSGVRKFCGDAPRHSGQTSGLTVIEIARGRCSI